MYERAKGDFDRSDYTAAADGFSKVLRVLNDPDVSVPASRPPLSDMRVLAAGFKDLAVTSSSMKTGASNQQSSTNRWIGPTTVCCWPQRRPGNISRRRALELR